MKNGTHLRANNSGSMAKRPISKKEEVSLELAWLFNT